MAPRHTFSEYPPRSDRKDPASDMEKALQQWMDAIGAIHDPIFIHDRDFRIVRANRAYAACAGTEATGFVGRPYWEVFPKGSGPLPGCLRSIHDPRVEGHSDEVTSEKGDIYLSRSFAVLDAHGSYRHSVHIMENITSRRQAEEHQRLAAEVFNATSESIMILDADQTIIDVNRAFCEITGNPPIHVRGRKPWQLDAMPDAAYFDGIWQALENTDHWRGEMHKRRKSGKAYPALLNISVARDTQGKPSYYILVFSDITDLKTTQQRFEYLASHDRLTGLSNRNLFYDRLQHSVEKAARSAEKLAVMFIDLDNFKTVNDTLGHDMGDRLLASAAERLRACTRKEDTIARLGGDEFTVLTENLHDAIATASGKARQIIDALAAPFQFDGHQAQISASVGIALYPDNGPDVQSLLKHADAAMYQAKLSGKNTYQFFTEEMNVGAEQRARMEHDLRRALDNDELFLAYQPQIELGSGRIIGLEALLRWRHPELGLIPPPQFIPVAEASGLILPIGDRILRAVCRQSAEWERCGIHSFRIAVNLSARQFHDPDLANSIRAALAENNAPASALDIELTENTMAGDTERTASTLRQLKEMGLHITIDDFGMGCSSLNDLKNLPIDALKIDGKFIRSLATSDADVATAIINMGHSMQYQVIAEEVETREQMEFLKARACDAVQGYYMSHPLLAEKVAAVLGPGGPCFPLSPDRQN